MCIYYMYIHINIYTYIGDPVSGGCESSHCVVRIDNYAYIYIYTHTGTPVILVPGSRLSGCGTPSISELGLSAFLHVDYVYIYNMRKYAYKYVFVYMCVD